VLAFSHGAVLRIPPDRTVTIGRSSECDCVLVDPRISRRHAAMSVDHRGRLVVEDLGSKQGTATGGVPLLAGMPRALEVGSIVTVGDIVSARVERRRVIVDADGTERLMDDTGALTPDPSRPDAYGLREGRILHVDDWPDRSNPTGRPLVEVAAEAARLVRDRLLRDRPDRAQRARVAAALIPDTWAIAPATPTETRPVAPRTTSPAPRDAAPPSATRWRMRFRVPAAEHPGESFEAQYREALRAIARGDVSERSAAPYLANRETIRPTTAAERRVRTAAMVEMARRTLTAAGSQPAEGVALMTSGLIANAIGSLILIPGAPACPDEVLLADELTPTARSLPLGRAYAAAARRVLDEWTTPSASQPHGAAAHATMLEDLTEGLTLLDAAIAVEQQAVSSRNAALTQSPSTPESGPAKIRVTWRAPR
jgi:hypothetical protein